MASTLCKQEQRHNFQLVTLLANRVLTKWYRAISNLVALSLAKIFDWLIWEAR